MIGPKAYARSLSKPSVPSSGHIWQYHSRSDNHSKKACWLVMLDLLLACPLLRKHVDEKKVFFGINHEMRDFQQGRKKDLDLVLCTSSEFNGGTSVTFASKARDYGIELEADEELALAGLPELYRAPVGSVLVALEAKACMTEHVKARPRLYDELNSSHLTIHGATDEAIAAGLIVINYAETFVSPGKNPQGTAPWLVNHHRQPSVTDKVLQKIHELPRRAATGREGFDALGVILLSCRNDGSEVELIQAAPSPQPNDTLYYDSMIHRMSQMYATRFALI